MVRTHRHTAKPTQLALGTRPQLVLVECETHPRVRDVVVQLIGE